MKDPLGAHPFKISCPIFKFKAAGPTSLSPDLGPKTERVWNLRKKGLRAKCAPLIIPSSTLGPEALIPSEDLIYIINELLPTLKKSPIMPLGEEKAQLVVTKGHRNLKHLAMIAHDSQEISHF